MVSFKTLTRHKIALLNEFKYVLATRFSYHPTSLDYEMSTHQFRSFYSTTLILIVAHFYVGEIYFFSAM